MNRHHLDLSKVASQRWRVACVFGIVCTICAGCDERVATDGPLGNQGQTTSAGPAQHKTQTPSTTIENKTETEPQPQTVLPEVKENANAEAQMRFDPEQLKFAMVTIGTVSEPGLGYGVVFERSSTGFDVITAEHLLGDRKNFVVHAWQGQEKAARLQAFVSVTVMHRDPDRDLAWLRVRGNTDSIKTLTLTKPTAQQPQAAWTYHIDKDQSVFTLNEIDKSLSAKRNDQSRAISYWRLKNRIEPGLSGGGLVSAQGQWIGIASGNGQGQAHYVDQQEIAEFLKAAGL